MPDKIDDAAACVCGITRENARPRVGAIRLQDKESTDLKRRGIKVRFLDTKSMG